MPDELGQIQDPVAGEVIATVEPVETTPAVQDETTTAPVETPSTTTSSPTTITIPAGMTQEDYLDFLLFQRQKTAQPAPAQQPAAQVQETEPEFDAYTVRYPVLKAAYDKAVKAMYEPPEIDTPYGLNQALWDEILNDSDVMMLADIREEAARARFETEQMRHQANKREQQATIAATREQMSTSIASMLPTELAEVAPDLADGFKTASPAFLADFSALTDEQRATWITNAAKFTLADKVIAARKSSANPSAYVDLALPSANQRQVNSGTTPTPLSTEQTAYMKDFLAKNPGESRARAERIARRSVTA